MSRKKDLFPKDYEEKFLWSSTTFRDWVFDQQKIFANAGFKCSTSGITHKLVKEILIPKKIKIQLPRYKL